MDDITNIYTDDFQLEALCLSIIQSVRDTIVKYPIKTKTYTDRERVEFWVEHFLKRALENAMEHTFGQDE